MKIEISFHDRIDTVYKRATEGLIERMPGKISRKITLKEVAQDAGVSTSTASRALSGGMGVTEETRRTIIASATKLGYRRHIGLPELVAQRKKVIGIVTPNISSEYYSQMMSGILRELYDADCTFIVADGNWSQRSELDAIHLLQTRHVDGLIALGGVSEDAIYEQLAEEMPLVVEGRRIEPLIDQCVWTENQHGGYVATNHLLEMGHQRIAHVAGPVYQRDAVERQQGYEQALREANIAIDPNLIVEGAFKEASGVMAVEMLMTQRGQFSAIFAANDLMAKGVLLGLSRRGLRVPEEVSVIGYDNLHGAAYTIPPLTTVENSPAQKGKLAGQSMVRLLTGKPLEQTVFRPALVIRESVARLMA